VLLCGVVSFWGVLWVVPDWWVCWPLTPVFFFVFFFFVPLWVGVFSWLVFCARLFGFTVGRFEVEVLGWGLCCRVSFVWGGVVVCFFVFFLWVVFFWGLFCGFVGVGVAWELPSLPLIHTKETLHPTPPALSSYGSHFPPPCPASKRIPLPTPSPKKD